ncbi:MAG: anaerobic ribonucleoside-triphosphate reductase activating protein [Clostridia bacterium]|nr:anaerobic ribonucleoside-triphosphate reductase activating protein [Clostridia bacterium]
MKIHGLQKMTLLDYPGKVACTVFLGGCDFRCPFCHNFELACGIAPPVMEEDELFAFLEKRRGLLDGVAVTGGEPCLRSDLPRFLERIRRMGYSVKLDTNGTSPDVVDALITDGLVSYVAMDIKNSPEKYAMTAGVPAVDLDAINRSIALLMRGRVDYEFRTTVIDELHEAADFHAIGRWIAGAPRYFLQPFTDRDTVPTRGYHAPSRERMQAYLAIVSGTLPAAEIRGMD